LRPTLQALKELVVPRIILLVPHNKHTVAGGTARGSGRHERREREERCREAHRGVVVVAVGCATWEEGEEMEVRWMGWEGMGWDVMHEASWASATFLCSCPFAGVVVVDLKADWR